MTELSRPVALDRLPDSITVEATPSELHALATRLMIPAVTALWCRFTLRRRGNQVQAEGVLEADVVQSCVVSLDPVEQHVAERFTVRFVPAGHETDDDDPAAPDEIPYDGAGIDLGEATVEQLALALDPYPRAPGAEFGGEEPEGAASPFLALRPKS